MSVSSAELFAETVSKLEHIYDKLEAQSLAILLLEHHFSFSRKDILINSEINFHEKEANFKAHLKRMQKGEPIQYVLGHAHFYGHIFEVNNSVLIPRPETEELVHLIKTENDSVNSIMDIGTGSGCIAISLKKEFPDAIVYALDISTEAIETAQRNAKNNNVDVNFIEADILSDKIILPEAEIIVSNPPYVKEEEKKLMKSNVLDYEPHSALFVENSDPFLFYRKIADKSKNILPAKGKLYFEINEKFGVKIYELLMEYGFINIEIVKDLYGKDRMVKGEKINQ